MAVDKGPALLGHCFFFFLPYAMPEGRALVTKPLAVAGPSVLSAHPVVGMAGSLPSACGSDLNIAPRPPGGWETRL